MSRVVKVDKGTSRRVEYAQAASEAAEVRAREIEDTKLAAEDARCVFVFVCVFFAH